MATNTHTHKKKSLFITNMHFFASMSKKLSFQTEFSIKFAKNALIKSSTKNIYIAFRWNCIDVGGKCDASDRMRFFFK